MGIVVIGAVFVDIKGYPTSNFIPAGRNVGRVEQVHGGVGRNVAEDIANCELRPTFVSLVDKSGSGDDVIRKLKNHKVNVDYIEKTRDGMGTWLAVFDNNGDVAGSISVRPDMMPLVELLEEKGDEKGKMPQIVIVIDELADLMMAAPGEVEDAICRLAQMARAAGMHLIIATQRPSVDVITGVIKANIPSRLAFAVSSGIDSRTILDMVGAEKLLGKGDMLFYPSGQSKPSRLQGAFVTDQEVESIVDFLKKSSRPYYTQETIDQITSTAKAGGGDVEDSDEFFGQAVDLIIEKEKASVSMLQRRFRIGYNRAAVF